MFTGFRISSVWARQDRPFIFCISKLDASYNIKNKTKRDLKSDGDGTLNRK